MFPFSIKRKTHASGSRILYGFPGLLLTPHSMLIQRSVLTKIRTDDHNSICANPPFLPSPAIRARTPSERHFAKPPDILSAKKAAPSPRTTQLEPMNLSYPIIATASLPSMHIIIPQVFLRPAVPSLGHLPRSLRDSPRNEHVSNYPYTTPLAPFQGKTMGKTIYFEKICRPITTQESYMLRLEFPRAQNKCLLNRTLQRMVGGLRAITSRIYLSDFGSLGNL